VTGSERRRLVEELCDAALDRDARRAGCIRGGRLRGRRGAATRGERSVGARAEGGGVSRDANGRGGAQVLGDARGASLVGRQVGSYEILSLLGAGGMGDVYRARDTTLGRDVAIKVVADAFLLDPSGSRASNAKRGYWRR
jgi:serine/threonine protein kinase